MFGEYVFVLCLLAVLPPRGIHCSDVNVTNVAERTENALAKLVKMFSKPGAFKQIDTLLGENTIEASYTSCPMGEEGLECRRAEARRSVDCPRGDCFCHDCAAAGPDLWASCCRESLRCCSHLAAACRTCDHPTLAAIGTQHNHSRRTDLWPIAHFTGSRLVFTLVHHYTHVH
ncbi:uncharacterized protein LOC126855177 isoform X1 [Cataglyphis hispanica]|uniref:uncharacterized protein LOC126855177 isoform X1 n=1 Tax=Cataglyphis hispanica TaxID=1086592 RepID=UPI00217F4207|nr:uncharacterized protein LOC126855177 isoform X1 [Cataglyphis hispanica]